MGKTVITDEKATYILNNYSKLSSRKISTELNVSKTAVLGFMKRNKLVVPLQVQNQWKVVQRKKPYTNKENNFIVAHISSKSIKKIALELSRSSSTLQKQVHILGLTKIVERKKTESRLKKGNVPPNAGKKMEDFMTSETLAKFKANQYKKEHIPHNALADNTEVTRTYKNGNSYVFVKVTGKRKLISKHRHIWQLHHKKKIPPSHKVVFKDGNTFNFNIDNLILITNENLMIKNSIHQYPEDLKEVLFIKGAITRRINNIKKITKQDGAINKK